MYCTFSQFIDIMNSVSSNNVKNDLNHYILKNNFYEKHYFIYDILYDKYSNPIIFLCNFKDQDISSLKHFYIYGFFGRYLSHNDLLQMELSLKIYNHYPSLEVIKIHAGSKKRQGRGSSAIKFLEETIIPYLNSQLKSLSNSYKINCIYGISADLDDDTSGLDRAKFYYKNEFKLINNHFYKYL